MPIAFPIPMPITTRRLLDKIEWHYTPKHGSWLNMAETEIRIMNGQCLDRRLDSQDQITQEVAAWERKRNALQARIHWTFTLAAARRKLHKLYPSIEDRHPSRMSMALLGTPMPMTVIVVASLDTG